MWCPKCRAEYRPGFTVCASCGVRLIDHPPTGGERYDAPPEPEERWLQDTPRRARLLRIVRTLIVLCIALAVVFLLQSRFG